MLSINAFNALLKTLEEPPAHAKFIFATTEPHKIPVTILSRCQRFDFRKIPLPRVAARLREIVDAERIEISDRALGLVARRGEGSMRDALSTLDQVIAFCGETVADDDVQGLLGMVDRRLLLDAVEGVLRRDSRQVLEVVRRVDNQGYSFRQFCQELVELFRALVLVRVIEEPAELLDVTADELHELRELAAARQPGGPPAGPDPVAAYRGGTARLGLPAADPGDGPGAAGQSDPGPGRGHPGTQT